MEIGKIYQKKRLQIAQTNFWTQFMIFALWMVIPFKLIVNASKTLSKLMKIKYNNDLVVGKPYKINYNEILLSLPIWKTPSFLTYVTTYNNNEVDGKNHLTANQTALNALYLFICSQTPEGKRIVSTEPAGKGLMLSMHTTGHLSNGFKYDESGHFINDVKSSSSYALANLNLAIQATDSQSVLDKYDNMIQMVIDNNFGLLEYEQPDDEIAKEAWLEKPIGKRKLKSVNAMFQPDPNLTGENALTLLASLKLSGIRRGNIDAQIIYKKLLWKNGYALLSLFPTKGELSQTAMYSLYVLAKNSKGAELKLWKYAALIQQKLAYNTEYEMLFSGLLYDAFPELLKESTHKNYLMNLNNKLSYVENKNNLGYLANYTMIKKSVNLMLEQNPEVQTV